MVNPYLRHTDTLNGCTGLNDRQAVHAGGDVHLGIQVEDRFEGIHCMCHIVRDDTLLKVKNQLSLKFL